MSTSNPQRFLANEAGTDDRSLALKMVFDGNVRSQFYNRNLLMQRAVPIIAHRNVGAGKSFQFINIADGPDAEEHTPGTELLGQAYAFDENTIEIDSILVKHYDVPLDQQRMSHFDVMASLGAQLGRKLKEKYERRLFVVGANAALTAAATKSGLTLHNGGNVVDRAGVTDLEGAYPSTVTGAENFVDDAYSLGRLMDEDNVPETNRFLFISPYIKQVLHKNPNLFDKDLTGVPADINKRVLGTVAGFMLVPTNYLPSTDIVDENAKYSGDFAYDGSGDGRIAALALASDGVEFPIGVVENMGITSHFHFDERRNTTFMKAQVIMGADVLSPYMAGAITVNN